MPYGPRYGLNYLHGAHVRDLPKLEFKSGDSFLSMPSAFPYDILLKGFDHMDPMFASASTPSRRMNEVIYPLIEFVDTYRGR